ncbi:bifunctional 4-hydroxy-4-methyl-2-oxoglutarate aldolase/oxaloacetate decarboxylase [Saccharomycopsis crataegensis]|uniref:Bifunctional 4-hydroxy-4-methyl-2-oxoglutarate aldolase/oxaloacetate decarboxylase n=1 Tax=Saccharomycopsis crataegensis TaxID=43959 RepID=A0AAV5QHV5_9ASCO|nr:bifunctional 4-hydroxy-4-methyl-2-oxoglutarate aldolase/oxaloacetate decarboxylase [Saccharomycopsis crataegensis]
MQIPSQDFLTQVISTLKDYSPCDVADALLKFGLPDGGFFPNLNQVSSNDSCSVGVAYTVTYAPMDDPRPELKQVSYIDQAPPGSMIVIGLTRSAQLPGAPYVKITNALYGGLMSTRAKYLEAQGTVVFGRVRDVSEHRALNYNVWSYGTGICAPKGAVKLVAVNEPVEVLVEDYYNKNEEGSSRKAYKTIYPGDIIIGDENGIARVPVGRDVYDDEWLSKIINYIPKRVEADELVAKDIMDGKKAKESQKIRRANL